MLQQLNTNRFLSDHFIYDEAAPTKFRIANAFWDWIKRIISWVWSPSSYTQENQKTISCFKSYLVDTLGAERLKRICSRYQLNLDEMQKKGSPLLSRDVAKIVIGARDVKVEDINEYIQKNQPRFPNIQSFQDLSSQSLAEIHQILRNLLPWQVADLKQKISGRPSEFLSRFFFDSFLADRERLQVCKENPSDSFDLFLHNMVSRVIKREMEIGTLIPAPNHPVTRAAQYYVVAGKLITGKGMVSYIILPATRDTPLEGVRLFRGTSARNSDIDGISTIITDLEKDLGRTAYESGLPYESILQQKLPTPPIETGHSLGSTLVQYRLANFNHIRKAYLYCGPGVPLREVDKFNRKRDPVQLFIRQAARDGISQVGQAHLGYQAPPHVTVDYLKYHTARRKDHDPHVVVWGREKHNYGIEGGIRPEQINTEFYHKNRVKECIRAFLGPPIAIILRIIRAICRFFIASRTDMQKGVRIGSVQQGRWQVEHFISVRP